MDEPTSQPDEPEERIDLTSDERADIEADLHDLESMRGLFASQGVKGVVIACQDCGANHFYEWELLQDNLDHMLADGRTADARAGVRYPGGGVHPLGLRQGLHRRALRHGLGAGSPDRGRLVPLVPDAVRADFRFCPRCGRSLGAVRMYHELVARGMDEREVRTLLVRAGYEPF